MREVAILVVPQVSHGALFHYLSIVEDDDSVTLLDSGESVSNHNGCSILHDLLKSFLHLGLRSLVKSRGSLVKEKDVGLSDDSSSDSNPLLLPS